MQKPPEVHSKCELATDRSAVSNDADVQPPAPTPWMMPSTIAPMLTVAKHPVVDRAM